MRYDYYQRLNRAQRRIYEASDAIGRIELLQPQPLRDLAAEVIAALASGRRPATELALRRLAALLCTHLGLPPLRVRVMATRPSADWGELHGLYEFPEGRRRAVLTVWMRTARHRRTVAPRTFLRTFLHEICHHFDHEGLGLADSFHTEGFFRRENSLLLQLLGPASPAARKTKQQGLDL